MHYVGWNAKFDEYLTAKRLRKAGEGDDGKDGERPERLEDGDGDEEDKSEKDVAEKKKRKKSIQQTGVEELPVIASEVVVNMPKLLERVLFDDWKKIVAQGCLVSLPRRPSVADVLRQYLDDVFAQKDWPQMEKQVLKEVCAGILRYFDRALGLVLLYRVERLQYLDLLESYPSTPLSQLYGPEHFLRLLVKMPNLVTEEGLEEMRPEEIFILNSQLRSIMRYLVRRSGELFGAVFYENQAPEYQRLLNL